jgi:hypothetical protein
MITTSSSVIKQLNESIILSLINYIITGKTFQLLRTYHFFRATAPLILK